MTPTETRWAAQIQAVLFDMDGTLLDSEYLTDNAVDALLERYGVEMDVDYAAFHGVTWRRIAEILRGGAPRLVDVPVEAELQEFFHRGLVEGVPPVIAGAREAVVAVAHRFGTALVSSSDRPSVEHVVRRLGLEQAFEHLVCAGDCTRSKPDPQAYQLAATRLGVSCPTCLVFEDSVAGVQAAKAAGMRVIAIGPEGRASSLADLGVVDFTALEPDFFRTLGCQ